MQKCENTTKFICHDEVAFIPGIQVWLNRQKSMYWKKSMNAKEDNLPDYLLFQHISKHLWQSSMCLYHKRPKANIKYTREKWKYFF